MGIPKTLPSMIFITSWARGVQSVSLKFLSRLMKLSSCRAMPLMAYSWCFMFDVWA